MARSVRRAGRITAAPLIATGAVALVGVGLVFAKGSVTTVGSEFMDALARGNVDKLTDMSYMADLPREKIREQWDFAVNKAAPYYRFTWAVAGASETADNTGYVRLKVTRNPSTGGYEENFQLPLLKVNGQWKVDVRSISRDLYPALPR